MLRPLPLLLAALVAIPALTGCQTNPATGERQFLYLDTQQEIQLGQQAAAEVTQQVPAVDSPQLQSYVSGVGQKLAGLSERPDLPWEFTVLNSDTINAFALPGGKVFIYRGLLDAMSNEAQLAGVLAHEVGHVTARHHNDRMVQQLGVQLVGTGLQVAGTVTDEQAFQYAGLATQVGGGLAVMKWGRDDEHQSDELGLRYMVEAGYNPRGMVQLMQVLRDASGGGGGPEWLSTHPTPASRIDELEQMIDSRFPQATVSNGFGYYEDRFQQQAQSVLRSLPPAPQPQTQGQGQ